MALRRYKDDIHPQLTADGLQAVRKDARPLPLGKLDLSHDQSDFVHNFIILYLHCLSELKNQQVYGSGQERAGQQRHFQAYAPFRLQKVLPENFI